MTRAEHLISSLTPADEPRISGVRVMSTADGSRTGPSEQIEHDEVEDEDDLPLKQRVDPDERDDYDEWRRERQSRGRKRRGKGSDRRRRRQGEELY